MQSRDVKIILFLSTSCFSGNGSKTYELTITFSISLTMNLWYHLQQLQLSLIIFFFFPLFFSPYSIYEWVHFWIYSSFSSYCHFIDLFLRWPLVMLILFFNIILLFINIYKFLFIINFMNVIALFHKHSLSTDKQPNHVSFFLACGRKPFTTLCNQIIIIVVNPIFIEV